MSFKKPAGIFSLIVFLFVFSHPAFCAPQSAPALREYFPGDIVHLIIEAPYDTSLMKATMPDNSIITLNYDGNSNVWHGYWEVPAGFPKGLYKAKMVATDLQGESFEGLSSPFYIGEPTLALMVRFAPKEGAQTQPQPAKEEAPKPEETSKMIQEIAGEENKSPAVKKTPPAQRIVKPEVNTAESNKARILEAAKASIAKSDYAKAKSQLQYYLTLDPNNQEAKTMINRLDAVMKTRGNNQ